MEAIEEYQRAIRLRPDYARAHVNLAKALRAQGQSREAIERFRRALEIEPDNVDPRVGFGSALTIE